MNALETLVAHYEAREAPDRSRPVVGYFGPDIPRELIEASGLLPLRLRGSHHPSALANEILGPRVEISARRVLTELLEGPPCDFVLLSHSSDAAVRLYTSLRRLDRHRLPETGFLDLLHLPTPTTAAYNLERQRELRELVGRWGEYASDESLASAIAESNRTRRLLERVKQLRRASPPLLTGTQTLAVIGAWTALPADRYNELLEELLSEAGQPLPQPGRRIYLSGSAHDRPELYLALESDGAQIVGEDHDWGEALADGLVGETGDPFAALAARYHSGCALARRGTNDRAAWTASEAAAAGAGTVVAWLRDGDGALAWGLPALRAEVETRGIQFVALEHRGAGIEGAREAVLA